MIRSFVLKASVFTLLTLGVNTLVLNCLDRHFYWGNALLTDKFRDLKQNHPDCNALFIGSSKTHRGVVPALFDSLAAPANSIKSYNLGIPAMVAPESYYVVEQLLADPELSLKWIFVELTGPQPGPGLSHTPRGKYYLTIDNYVFAARAAAQSHQNKKGKLSAIGQYSVNFAERLCLFGLFEEYRDNILEYDDERLEPYRHDDNGFLSYEQEIAFSAAPDQIRLGKKRQAMLKDTTVILRKIRYAPPPTSLQPAPEHLRKLRRLIALGKAKGVNLVFYSMQSRWKYNNYIEIQTLLNGIDEPHKLDIGHDARYPALFYAENLYNAEHLNDKGARLFTAYLAEAFRKQPH